MEEIRKKIFELADEKYQEFQSSLCPKINNIVGVRVPILRKYAKELAKGDSKKYLEEISNDYYEEILLKGMLIGLGKFTLEERLEYLKNFIPFIDNWAVCDITCGGLKFTQKAKQEVWDFLQYYLESEKEFEIRFGVVMLLSYYIEEEYVEKVLIKINQITHEGYYVKMAVAWLISIAYIKFPQETMIFLKDNQLDDFTFNKALQKIVESYRISQEEKEIIRELKRK